MSEREHEAKRAEIGRDLAAVLNKHGIDNACNTPDFILAELVMNTLAAYEHVKSSNEAWHGQQAPRI